MIIPSWIRTVAEVNPHRITQALDLRELYGPEVDVACGGEEPMVDEWEAGLRKPTLRQLRNLARLTGFPVPFFAVPDGPPIRGWICQRSGPGKGCRTFVYPEPEPTQGSLF